MAMRKCPNCLTALPAGTVAAHSYDLVCPGCQRPLEVAGVSRNLAVAAGLAAGAAAYVFAAGRCNGEMLGWLLPMVYGFLALSIVAPLVLMITADLRLKAAEDVPIAAPSEPAAGHGGGHH
ncbi:MAG: hypothetical protein ACRD4K_02770 [Candidatus Acidiferrales bacterium]